MKSLSFPDKPTTQDKHGYGTAREEEFNAEDRSKQGKPLVSISL